MTGRWGRCLPVVLIAVAVGTAGLAVAYPDPQPLTNPNERDIRPTPNSLDSSELANPTNPDRRIWALDFRFKDPRMVTVNIPGRGPRTVWFLWYQVINNTGKPRIFIPEFELKAHDLDMVYRDEVSPSAEAAIRQLEDPQDLLKIKNSVTIFRDPIPPTLPNAIPTAVSGVAVFMDPNEPVPGEDPKVRDEKAKKPKLANTMNFSIYVAGLSNGWAETDAIGQGDERIVRRKTLQLNFKRVGDRAHPRSEDVEWIPPGTWIYRGSTLKLPGLVKQGAAAHGN
jgi:hypothetical protein